MNHNHQDVLGELYRVLDFKPGENLVSQIQTDEVYQSMLFRQAKQKLGADAVFFFKPRGSNISVPYIYFRRLEAQDPRQVSVEIAELHKLAWNMGKAPLLFVVLTDGRILIYNTFQSPTDPVPGVEYGTGLIDSLDIYSAAEGERRRLLAYRRSELESGRYWQVNRDRFDPKQQAHYTLLNHLKITRRKLLSLLSESMPAATAAEIVHSLLGRSIFIKYLEDRRDSAGRNVFPEGFFSGFRHGATCFMDVLSDKDATYRLFDYLNAKFNGDMFPIQETERDRVTGEHLLRLQEFLTGEQELVTGQLSLWKFYSFDVIPIEFISNVYEEFFHIQAADATEGSAKNETHYTPHHLVEFLVDEVFPWDGQKTAFTILDPACGSGIFLVEIYRRLIAHWFQAHPDQSSITPFQLNDLLVQNVFGVDLNPEAIRVAAFSLYLTMCDFLEPRQIWEDVRFSQLRGHNLFCSDFFADDLEFVKRKYDLVIGNPPWASRLTHAAIQYRARMKTEHPKREIAPDNQISIAFLWRAAEFCEQDGRACLIMPSKGLLFNRSNPHRVFRKEFFARYNIKTVINFSVIRHALFSKAVDPATAIIYAPSEPDDTKPILYCTPKPAHSLVDKWQFVIDSQDIAMLPRSETREDDVIWKVAMWGGPRDYALIKRLMSPAYTTLGQICKDRQWVNGEGVIVGKEAQRKNDASWLVGKPYVEAKSLNRFAVNEAALPLFEISKLQRPRPDQKAIFSGPHVLLKQSPLTGESGFRAALLLGDAVFRHSLIGINGPVHDLDLLVECCIALNSRVPLYFAMMSSRRWLVERDELEEAEVMTLPMPKDRSNQPVTVGTLRALSQDPDWESKVAALTEGLFGLTRDEQILVDDAINFTLDFFRWKGNSKAVKPTFSQTEGDRLLKEYLDVMIYTLEGSFGKPFTTTIFEHGDSPLRVVAVKLSETGESGIPRITIEGSQPALDLALQKADEFLKERRLPNVFIQRNVRAYIGKTIYVVKPDQQRYWTRASALRDADEIYVDIMQAWRPSL
ncbi:N-6 DNA methylase [Candidatus Amarolinea dominans]|uniref:HsdM family class I SAM-dependent methyltransferase n=1 Tax=Candidatus Amarolinea dominans TaxID=3140696 RepID=UPI0031366B8B|nr:N-6 DNA methylase [Anaerolineae bacterium]